MLICPGARTQGEGDTGPPFRGDPVSRPAVEDLFVGYVPADFVGGPLTMEADLIRALAHRLGRLSPDWRDPARYFERRDEIERELRRIARMIEGRRNG